MADLRIPKPEIHTGPKHMTVDEATIHYLREAAERVRAARIWGSGVSALVATVLDDTAAALLASSAPATASEGATECNCGYGGFHEPLNPLCQVNIRAATGVTSSDGDRRLSEEPIPRCPHGAPTWACVDHPSEGQITVERAIEAWEAKGPTSLTVALMAEALYSAQCRLAARTAQPEGVERVEWGVLVGDDDPDYAKRPDAPPMRFVDRENAVLAARRVAGRTLVRRTVTTYAPVVGPWEVVGDE